MRMQSQEEHVILLGCLLVSTPSSNQTSLPPGISEAHRLQLSKKNRQHLIVALRKKIFCVIDSMVPTTSSLYAVPVSDTGRNHKIYHCSRTVIVTIRTCNLIYQSLITDAQRKPAASANHCRLSPQKKSDRTWAG